MLGAPRRVSYRLDLYLHEGRYIARIEHLLTKEKRTFSSLDRDAIMDFVTSRLPPVDHSKGVDFRPQGARLEVDPEDDLPRGLRLVPAVQGRPSHVLIHDSAFEVGVKFEADDPPLDAEMPVEHDVVLYARPLPRGSRQLMGHTHGVISPTQTTPIVHAFADSLTTGLYRLEATGTLKTTSGRRLICRAREEGALVQVV